MSPQRRPRVPVLAAVPLFVLFGGCATTATVNPTSNVDTHAATTSTVAPDNRDHFVGWYELPPIDWRTATPGSDPATLIPVLKRGPTYCTVIRAMEVPLIPCEQGLAWPPHRSSLAGTTIGYDAAADEYYIRIFDSIGDPIHTETPEMRSFEPGLRRTLVRIDPPPWLRDTTAPPPTSLDDFLTMFEAQLMPLFAFDIHRAGDAYKIRVYSPFPSDDGTPQTLAPLVDGLGFEWEAGHGRLIYNAALRRYELAFGRASADGHVARMPLFRYPRTAAVGIPHWH